MFNRLCIVGVGLIGGSFGLAARECGLAREDWGVARRQSTLTEALQVGACDYATSNLIEAATGADFVFLAPPVGQMRATCEEIAPFLAENALVTDAGSTKAQIVADCEPIFEGKARFLGSHPMAGGEKTGVLAARADLFRGAVWIVTPTPQTAPGAISQLEAVLAAIGAKSLHLEAKTHDELLAVSSHLPHVAAAALVQTFSAKKAVFPAISHLVAGGFRDSTRVAAGSPEMWRDICLSNRKSLETALDELMGQLAGFQSLLSSSDSEALLQWFDAAARERRQL